MRRSPPLLGLASLLCLALGGLAVAGEPPPPPPPAQSGASSAGVPVQPAQPSGPRAGQPAPAFSLKTVDAGQARALESFTKAKGKKGAVVVFLSCRCPYVVQARAPLAELYKQYGEKVSFVGLNANQNEKLDDIRTDAASSFPFPILRDEGSKVADLYGADRTPEAFVVDSGGTIRYHGGVADLGPALAQLVAGTPVAKAESKAFGCTIKRKP